MTPNYHRTYALAKTEIEESGRKKNFSSEVVESGMEDTSALVPSRDGTVISYESVVDQLQIMMMTSELLKLSIESRDERKELIAQTESMIKQVKQLSQLLEDLCEANGMKK